MLALEVKGDTYYSYMHDDDDNPTTSEVNSYFTVRRNVQLIMSLSLNFLMFGDEKFRYLVVREKKDRCHIVAPQRHVRDINELSSDEFPIFLARDVFKLVGERSTGSMSRFLNKTQELKTCVKVSFSGTKVEGIHNCVVINFVSVKAVFRALFAGNDAHLQKLVANKLWNLWLRCCDQQLSATMDYTPTNETTNWNLPCTDTAPDVSRCQLIDDLLLALDSHQHNNSYRKHLRNLLNSLRSLCVKLAGESVGEVLKSCDDLMQSLIEYDGSHDKIENAILDVASGWLGREFSAMNSSVHLAVEKFKSENIDSIDSLPSAYATCCRFPKPMVTLFENWLHTGGNEHGEIPSKRSRTDEADVYRFIQLLLEFSNNSLISGVAHVVYTQLLKDPT